MQLHPSFISELKLSLIPIIWNNDNVNPRIQHWRNELYSFMDIALQWHYKSVRLFSVGTGEFNGCCLAFKNNLFIFLAYLQLNLIYRLPSNYKSVSNVFLFILLSLLESLFHYITKDIQCQHYHYYHYYCYYYFCCCCTLCEVFILL